MNRLGQARVAAISLEQGAGLVRLLHANGRTEHAANVEAALKEATEILCQEFGHELLNEAIAWVAEQTGTTQDLDPSALTRH